MMSWCPKKKQEAYFGIMAQIFQNVILAYCYLRLSDLDFYIAFASIKKIKPLDWTFEILGSFQLVVLTKITEIFCAKIMFLAARSILT